MTNSIQRLADTLVLSSTAHAESELELVVITPDGARPVPLASRHTYLIGRDRMAHVQVTDGASRRHAELAIESFEQMTLTDLGSKNGTYVGQQRLLLEQPCPIQIGDTFEIGRALLVVRRTPAEGARGWILSHHYFVCRLREECEVGRSFGLVRLRTSLPPARVLAAFDRFKARGLLALYGSNESEASQQGAAGSGFSDYEIMLSAASERAAGPSGALEDQLRELEEAIGDCALFGSAIFPRDGSSPDALLDEVARRFYPARSKSTDPFLGQPSTKLRAVHDRARKFAQAVSGTILITGESGVGKTAIARFIHQHSERRERPFVHANCAAFAPGLIESELFGHVRGAFPGAVANRAGCFEAANGGFLFLDEIHRLPLDQQGKLLSVLERGNQRAIVRVGASVPIEVDVRVIVASTRDLVAACQRGEFLPDLYHRITLGTLEVPALRDRPEELSGWIEAFVRRCSEENRFREKRLSEAAALRLSRYSWPGNVRELANVIDRAVILSNGPTIEVGDLELVEVGVPRQTSPGGRDPDEELLRRLMADPESRRNLCAILRSDFRMDAAAKSLGKADKRALDPWRDRMDREGLIPRR